MNRYSGDFQDLQSVLKSLLKTTERLKNLIRCGNAEDDIDLSKVVCSVEESTYEEYRLARETGMNRFFVRDFLKYQDEKFIINTGDMKYYKVLIQKKQEP